MLDAATLLRQPSEAKQALLARGLDAEFIDETFALLEARRRAQQHKEALQQEQNEASGRMQTLARQKEHEALASLRERVKALKASVQQSEQAYLEAERAALARLLLLPNTPDSSVPDGRDESGNVRVRSVGEPDLAAEALPHWDVGEKLGLLDFARASNTSGARFSYLLGGLALLERALCNFMLDQAQAHGHRLVSPPLLVRPETMQQCGQYPKFLGESFETQDRELVLIPTSEVSLLGLHAQEILPEEALPLRYTALTPCFRREAGAAGRDTRGLVRQHQFYKVELVSFTTAEQSQAEHQRMLAGAEQVLQALQLPYRTMHLCKGDMGFAAASTFDIEVWLAGQKTYREISSVSTCGDFQARRAQIRCRPGGAGGDAKNKPRLVHTLNGSALAVGRTLVAILENYQQPDGRVTIPDALKAYMPLSAIEAEPLFAV